jgi:hypothetical protein
MALFLHTPVLLCGMAAATDHRCDPPVAGFFQMNDTITGCNMHLLELDGSPSWSSSEIAIVQWIWRDGADMLLVSSEPELAVQLESGLHHITLQVIDDQGCESTISAPLVAIIGLPAVIEADPLPDLMCVGTTLPLAAQVTMQPFLSASIFCSEFEQPVLLPEFMETPMTFTTLLNAAGPEAVVGSEHDIVTICIDIEHSFMSDLFITLTCPTGQWVILHGQGGGGTYLGAANDLDGPEVVPGTCWNYCWAPDAPNGTMAASAASGHTILAGTPPWQTLIPDTYSSHGSLNDLTGCPVNGEWTLSIHDFWGGDNGSFCGWCPILQNAIDSALMIPAAIAGSGPDSAFWSGPGVVNDPKLTGSGQFTPPAAGSHDLTYTVIDDHGCVHEFHHTIHAVIPEVDAGPDLELCEGPQVLAGALQGDWGPAPLDRLTIQWTPAAGLNDPSDLQPFVFPNQSGWHVLHVGVTGMSDCFAVDSAWVGSPETGTMMFIHDPAIDLLCVNAFDLASYDWYWNGTFHATTTDPCVSMPGFGHWWCIGHPQAGCSMASENTLICPELSLAYIDGELMVQPHEGTFIWSFNGETLEDMSGPAIVPEQKGFYSVTLTTAAGCIVSAALDLLDLFAAGGARTMEFVLFPNPTTGDIAFKAMGFRDGEVPYTIHDLQGRIIGQGTWLAIAGRVNEQLSLDIAPGTYLLQVGTAPSRTLRFMVH